MPKTKTINLLLANSEGRVSNLIEALVRDVCHTHAVVHSTRATRPDELDRQVGQEQFDLVIVVPQTGKANSTTSGSTLCYTEAATAIRNLKYKSRGTVATLAVGVPLEHQDELSRAGADCVLEAPFNCDEVKSSVRELLHLPVAGKQSPPDRSLLSWFQSLAGEN